MNADQLASFLETHLAELQALMSAEEWQRLQELLQSTAASLGETMAQDRLEEAVQPLYEYLAGNAQVRELLRDFSQHAAVRLAPPPGANPGQYPVPQVVNRFRQLATAGGPSAEQPKA